MIEMNRARDLAAHALSEPESFRWDIQDQLLIAKALLELWDVYAAVVRLARTMKP